MAHLTPQEILDLPRDPSLAGAEAAAHIKSCPACREALQAQQQLWDALGDWPAPASADQTPAIIARLDALPAAPRTRHLWPLLRVAAVLALSTSVGIAAAWWSRPNPAASPEDVALSLHLHELDASDPLSAIAADDADDRILEDNP